MLRTPQYKLCAAAVALSAPAVLLFSPEIFKSQPSAVCRSPPRRTASCWVGGQRGGGGMLLPAVSDRLGRKPVLYAVYLGLAAGSAWFAFAGQWWVLAAYAVLTFFYSGGAAVQPSFNTDLFGLPHAGVNYGFLALGQSVGSLLFPCIADLWGFEQGRHILAIAGAAAGFAASGCHAGAAGAAEKTELRSCAPAQKNENGKKIAKNLSEMTCKLGQRPL